MARELVNTGNTRMVLAEMTDRCVLDVAGGY
jgi:hypothetical protein